MHVCANTRLKMLEQPNLTHMDLDADYFLTGAFVLSCLGFLFFLSFFCELLPLPMVRSPY